MVLLVLVACALGPAPAPAKTFVGQKATLTDHATGMPTVADPGKRLQRAEIEVDYRGLGTAEVDGFLSAKLTLQGDPAGAEDAGLVVGLGTRSGSTCDVRNANVSYTSASRGRVYEVSDVFYEIPGKWNCAVVALDNGVGAPPTATYDALVGGLTDVYESPKPKITGVELLGKKQRSLKLVRGAWTKLGIAVKNAGVVDAGSLRVRGNGKKLRVKGGRASDGLNADWDDTVDIQVKPVGKVKRSKLRIVVNADGAKTKRALKVRVTKPPRPPANGSYRSKDGRVTFKIKKRRIVGWRGYMQTQCGGYPDFPQYTMNTYDFPRVKVGRNGLVDASDRKKDLYSAHLQLRAVGRKVTAGTFRYYGPNRCRAWVSFSAKRTGR